MLKKFYRVSALIVGLKQSQHRVVEKFAPNNAVGGFVFEVTMFDTELKLRTALYIRAVWEEFSYASNSFTQVEGALLKLFTDAELDSIYSLEELTLQSKV